MCSATRCSRPRPPPSPTSTARRCASSTTCSTRCTTVATGWRSPRRRSACRSRSWCGTSATTRRSSSTQRSSTADGEWVYEEGCLSIPGLYVELARPKTVLVRGVDLDGNPIEREADELEARMFQHELDHLNGVLMFDRMTPDQRRDAMVEYRRISRAERPAGTQRRASAPALALTTCRPLPKRLVYLGTPAVAVAPLRALHAAGHEIVLVVSQPDRRRGRGGATSPSPVKAAALDLGLPVTDRIDDVIAVRRRAGRRRGLRPVDPSPRPRRRPDGQHALQPAAALARRGAGRAGHPRRRHRDRRVHHGRRRRSSTSATSTPWRRFRSGTRRPPTSCASRLVDVGTDLLLEVARRGTSRADSADRRDHLRREAAPRGVAARLVEPAVALHRWVRAGQAWTTFRGKRLRRPRRAFGPGR